MEENLPKWQSCAHWRCSWHLVLHFFSSLLIFGYGHSAQSVKAVVSPSCLAWNSLWPLAVISPSSPRVFPIPALPISWHQADQRLGVAEGITVQRPLLSQWETRTRREPDRNCSFFHLPGRLFWGVPYCFLELLAECLIKAPCNGFLIFAWYLYFAIPTFEY